jgi:alkanesulfonate monooxygenase SsuD/methylene tetrahydromethanopterin reductase-like flavin-dependent oxidoreductase (luciferase family)
MNFQLVVNMERHSPTTDMTAVAAHTLDMVRMADAGGFESVWAAEHHSTQTYVAPNPFQILTWWAAHTSRIRLGAAVVVAPFWHPIKVAEESALLDLYSGGRMDLGFGSGALQREFDRLAPGVEQSAGRDYIAEMLPAVKALWAGDHEHDGELWSFPTACSVPTPVQTPHPPVWMAARSPDSFELAAKHGCNVMTWAMTRPFSEVETYLTHFETALQNNPRDVRPLLATMRHVAVVERDAEIDEVVAALHRQLARLDHLRRNVGGVKRGFVDPLDVASIKNREEFARDELVHNLMFGSPERIVEKLERYRDLGIDRFTYCASFGLDPGRETRSLELFIEKVMPHFSG